MVLPVKKALACRQGRWLALAMVWMLAGCAIESTTMQELEENPAATESTPPKTLDPSPEESPIPCPQEISAEIETVILAQSASFALRDYETAYSYSSESFQAAVSLDLFERLISRNYEMLLYFEEAVFGACELAATGTTAAVFVEVRSSFQAPVIMEYELVSEKNAWKVFAVTNPVPGVPNA